jgi:hypothetical protein
MAKRFHNSIKAQKFAFVGSTIVSILGWAAFISVLAGYLGVLDESLGLPNRSTWDVGFTLVTALAWSGRTIYDYVKLQRLQREKNQPSEPDGS